MKLRVIIPITSDALDERIRTEIALYVSDQTEVEVIHLDEGPASIESEYDSALAAPDMLAKIQEAEELGFDGVHVSCFGDPAINAAREFVNIPVVGAGEPPMLLAGSLGQRFSVVTILDNVVPLIENLAHAIGVSEKLASTRVINVPVLSLDDESKVKKALRSEMLAAIKDDRAHVLVLGCTGMSEGLAKALQEELKNEGYDVPVIDPTAASILFLESLVKMGVKQSKLTYMTPTVK